MLFNSLAFIIFLPCVFIVYWLMPHKFRWVILLISSYYFYMSWDAKYIVLILSTTIISYAAARIIENQDNKNRKKSVLMISGLLCLSVLFVFKYFNFAFESIANVLNAFSIKLNPWTLDLLLPVGISFYTFQTLSYVVDVYREEIPAEHHFGHYATFVAFFPQLVAGPIERTKNLLPQIKAVHKFDYDEATYGLKLIAWGFFKKLCIADVIAVYVDEIYSSLESNVGFPMIAAVLGFTIQIYCDFSGYSDIAIGTAKLLDISLMENFKSPYFSRSVKEFWSRWHISLSTWFRDYVYIPLGGNRCYKVRNIFNLMVTFLVSGLWHGASWTFVVWGAIHGVAQVIERMFEKYSSIIRKKYIGAIASWFLVFVFCNIAWVFFRANSIKDAFFVISHFFTGINQGKQYFSNTTVLGYYGCVRIVLVVGLLALFDFFSLKTDVIRWIGNRPVVIRWIVYILFIMLIYLFAQGGNNSFIYFQF